MTKKEAYKLARFAAEHYACGSPIQDDEDWLEMIAHDYRCFIDYLYDNQCEITEFINHGEKGIIEKHESTVKTTVG